MLVDDELNTLYILKKTLEKNGFNVIAYTDPLAALDKLKESGSSAVVYGDDGSSSSDNHKSYWHNELKSLGIDPKRKCELNDKEELAELVDNIKQVYYQAYKLAYSDKEIDKSHFNYIT